MGRYVKVRPKDAEKTRRKLQKNGVYDRDRLTEHEGGCVFFPVKQEVGGYEVVELSGRKVEKTPASLKEALKEVIDCYLMKYVPSSFDVIGDIAILELPKELAGHEKEVGEALMKSQKNVKTVALKDSSITTRYRTRRLRIAAGKEKTWTIHREHGMILGVDVEKAYFSPRSSHERQRVCSQIEPSERVLVLFAGIGPFAILAAKKGSQVTAVELNHEAVRIMKDNCRRNRVDVKVVEGDAKEVTPGLGLFDRIIMPLPKDSESFLEVALNALENRGIIHYYAFSDGLAEAEMRVGKACQQLGYQADIVDSVYCGSYSPRLSRICVDFRASKIR